MKLKIKSKSKSFGSKFNSKFAGQKKFKPTLGFGSNRKKETEDDDDSSSLGTAGWMLKGKRADAAVAQQRVQSQTKYAPEFWLNDGETKVVRFRQAEELCCLKVYQMKVGGKWKRYTAPAQGERDRFAEAGLKATIKAIYELIDIEGYTDKKGKKHKNISRFFVTSGKVREQLTGIRERRGDLCDYDIEVRRTGSGQQTQYNFQVESPSDMTSEMKKAEKLAGRIEEFFAPPSDADQKAILAGYEPDEQD